jgi:hypothetical protein
MYKTTFDPEEIGTVEFTWWKAHHKKNKSLMAQMLLKQNILLYELNKIEAQKTLDFLIRAVKGHDLRDWGSAIKAMTKYYQIIKNRTGLEFKPKDAAELEIGWWKLHDQLEYVLDKTPLEQAFIKLYACIFGVETTKLQELGKYRARATYEHDLAEDPKTPSKEVDTHWQNTKNMLIKSYRELLSAIN